MSDLMSALLSAGRSLEVFQRSLGTVNNNVVNSSTAGYARQRPVLEADTFQPSEGLAGGVLDGGVQDTRNDFAEQAVRSQSQMQYYYQELSARLETVQDTYDLSGQSGIAGALNDLLTSFSSWSATPNGATQQQAVLDSAKNLANAFAGTMQSLSQQSQDLDASIQSTVDHINQIGAALSDANVQILKGAGDDAGLQAKIYSNLEELSQLANFSVLHQADGTFTVLLGGQTPLVMGAQQYQIDTPPDTVKQGQLGALLEMRGQIIPAQQQFLNGLAENFATTVNGIFGSSTPAANANLFLFTTGTAASTLKVNGALQAGSLQAGTATVSNGVPLDLAALSTAKQSTLNNRTFSEYFGALGASIGRSLENASTQADTYKSLTAQAQDMREKASGVSLDEEAVYLIQFQRAYQAAARMISVLNQLTETTINMVQ